MLLLLLGKQKINRRLNTKNYDPFGNIDRAIVYTWCDGKTAINATETHVIQCKYRSADDTI